LTIPRDNQRHEIISCPSTLFPTRSWPAQRSP